MEKKKRSSKSTVFGTQKNPYDKPMDPAYHFEDCQISSTFNSKD